MSFFVLIYDRDRQEILDLQRFDPSDRAGAEELRLKAQRRALDEHLDHEIVLFQAASEESLRRTHGSYFLTERELLERMQQAVEASYP